MRPVLVLPLLIALGCPQGDTGTPPEGDTDTDTDTDVDPALFDGTWAGEAVVEVYERSLGLSGICRGDASFVFDHGAATPVLGLAACDWDGQPIEEYVPPLSFAFAGASSGGDRFGGEVVTTASNFDATGPWSGSVSEDRLLVTWTGTVNYYHYVVDCDGSTEAGR